VPLKNVNLNLLNLPNCDPSVPESDWINPKDLNELENLKKTLQ
jgi:hypothetical protein